MCSSPSPDVNYGRDDEQLRKYTSRAASTWRIGSTGACLMPFPIVVFNLQGPYFTTSHRTGARRVLYAGFFPCRLWELVA